MCDVINVFGSSVDMKRVYRLECCECTACRGKESCRSSATLQQSVVVNFSTVGRTVLALDILLSTSQQGGSVIQTGQLMLYREIIAVCSQIHTKHINTLCGQNVELLNVKLAVRTVTIRLQRLIAQLHK